MHLHRFSPFFRLSERNWHRFQFFKTGFFWLSCKSDFRDVAVMEGTFGLPDGETRARGGSRITQRLLLWLTLAAAICLGRGTSLAAAPEQGSNVVLRPSAAG